MQDFEKLGVFYLGKRYDTAAARLTEDLILYDSGDLTTHAAIIGMTGSGKTGLGIGLLEEAAMDGIPVIAIDPKGDLGNLLLTFPELSAAAFRPGWMAEDARGRGSQRGRLGRGRSGPLEERPCRLGSKRRPHRAAARGRGVRHLHAGKHGRCSAVDPQIVRASGAGQCSTMRNCSGNG